MRRAPFITATVTLPMAMLAAGLTRPLVVQAQSTPKVTVVAGTGEAGYAGDGGPATEALLTMPYGAAISPSGLVYWSEHGSHTVRRRNADGTVTRIAGTSRKRGFAGDGGPATEAQLNVPLHLAFDAVGNLYVADSSNGRIRKVTPEGIISTVAGGGNPADLLGDGGPATAAQLNGVHGLAVDPAGNLYIADTGNYRVRKVTPEGMITTVAGTGKMGFSGDGGPATEAQLNTPAALALDGVANLYIVEYGPDYDIVKGQRVRRVSPDGIIGTVVGSGERGYTGDGGPAVAASVRFLTGIAVDSAGSLFIADWGSHRIRKVDPTGNVTTVVGNGEQSFTGDGLHPAATGLRGPWGLTIDSTGNLFIADTRYAKNAALGGGERILKVSGLAAAGLLAGRPFQSP